MSLSMNNSQPFIGKWKRKKMMDYEDLPMDETMTN
jgi:hypothetical protein